MKGFNPQEFFLLFWKEASLELTTVANGGHATFFIIARLSHLLRDKIKISHDKWKLLRNKC